MTTTQRTTYKLAVIGDPISHSLSPLLHQAALKSVKIRGRYHRVHVTADQLESFLAKMRAGEFDGINVTIPHKEAVVAFVDRLTPGARMIGAVNTIRRVGNKLQGFNTDGDGYLKSLQAELKFSPSHKHVVVIGAGGAGLGICFALCRKKIESLTILNRKSARAKKLAQKLQGIFPHLKIRAAKFPQKTPSFWKKTHLVINATSQGMNGTPWTDLRFIEHLPQNCVVSDIVYKPHLTPLLAVAQKRGMPIHFGIGMLIHQAALAFAIFTGARPSIASMRKAVADLLTA